MNNHIIVIDDDKDTLHLIDVKLSKAGYKVKTARDGESGFKLATEYSTDLIILGIMMPGEDGISVCKRIKNEIKNPPVILMLTSNGEDEYISDAFSSSADDYMTKPFSPTVLEERVRVNLIKNNL
ncbi:MAG: response regulator transcription factor [bacterium]|nr:response regulator transcription factor [bacterium]